MAKKSKINEAIVFPGEKLAVIEEYSKGNGTYEEKGNVRSHEIGKKQFDKVKRQINVKKKTPELIIPEEGMEVIAEVGSVARRDARVDIFMLNNIPIFPSYNGVVHISDISKNYVKNIDITIRSGDIIKAKIVNTKNNLNQLSIADRKHGVIYAYCSRCGELLELRRGKLTCDKCNRVERRKYAKDYGEVDIT